LFVKEGGGQFFDFDVKLGMFDEAFLDFFVDVGVMVADKDFQLLPEVLDLALEMGVSLSEFSIFDVRGQKIVIGELQFGMEGIDLLGKGLNVKIGGLR
jgi:hypothetical protein